jgi:hypothetical protein
VKRRTGSLLVVGLGLNGWPQTTPEAASSIEAASRVFYLSTEPTTAHWIRALNPAAESLLDCYAEGKPRQRTYAEMVERIMAAVRDGHRVCAAFYGHPGVFVNPSHTAIRRARREGFPARMLPGVSADACFYADLLLNPGERGIQSYEATDFLIAGRRIDPTAPLLLWQVGVVGEMDTRKPGEPQPREGLERLARRLRRDYPATHTLVLYRAATFAAARAVVRRVRLARLPRTVMSPLTTMYVPPLEPRPIPRWAVRWLQGQ